MTVAAPWSLHVFVSSNLKILAIYWKAWFKKGLQGLMFPWQQEAQVPRCD